MRSAMNLGRVLLLGGFLFSLGAFVGQGIYATAPPRYCERMKCRVSPDPDDPRRCMTSLEDEYCDDEGLICATEPCF